MSWKNSLRSAAAAICVFQPALSLAQSNDQSAQDDLSAGRPRPMYNENAKYDDKKKLCFYEQVNDALPLRGFIVSANEAMTSYPVLEEVEPGKFEPAFTFDLAKGDMVAYFADDTFVSAYVDPDIVNDVYRTDSSAGVAILAAMKDLAQMPDPTLESVRRPFASLCAQHFKSAPKAP